MFSNLRTRLILLVLLAALPALALTLYSGLAQRQRSADIVQGEALQVARLAIADQEQLIESTRGLLVALAQVPSLSPENLTDCQDFLSNLLAEFPSYTGFVAVTPVGDLYCSAPVISSATSFTDREWFQRVIQSQQPVVGEYVIGRVSGKAALVIAQPVFDSAGQLQAILGVGLDLEWLNQLAAETQLPSDTTLTVFDHNNIILTRFPDPEEWVGEPVPEGSILAAIGALKEGTLKGPGLDGEERLFAIVPLLGADGDVYVSVGILAKVAFAEVERMLILNLSLIGLTIALALVVAWWLGDALVVRPTNKLVEAAQRLASGELSARTGLGHSKSELGQLAKAFDEMAGSLEGQISARERAQTDLRRVNRVLKTLSDSNQALVRAKDEMALVQQICSIVVEVGGYRLAWVGYAEQDEGKTVRPVAQSGYEKGYLKTIHISWADTELGRGPTGTAIRTGRKVISKDIPTNPEFAPWREEALKRGYTSSIALPLKAEEAPLGALNVYAAKPDAFDSQEVELLEELAEDLSYGILALRTRAEREHFAAQSQRQLERLSSLREIDTAISASLDLRVTMNVILTQVISRLDVDASSILLLNPEATTLTYGAVHGFRGYVPPPDTLIEVRNSYAGQAIRSGEMVRLDDLRAAKGKTDFLSAVAEEGFVAYFGVPLIVKGHTQGVLEIFHRKPLHPDQEWLAFLEALAGQTAIALDHASLFTNLQRSNADLAIAYDETLEGWTRALDLRDNETEGHTQRVAEMSVKLAAELGMNSDELIHLRRGALLHDIGKIGIPDRILLKPGPLTKKEWEIMHKHPSYAFELLSPIDYLKPALDIPYAHHERWDGKGYPRRLKGEDVPFAARIFAVIDVWDALRSDRPYRKAWSGEKALGYIREQKGKHFDPQVVELFLANRDANNEPGFSAGLSENKDGNGD